MILAKGRCIDKLNILESSEILSHMSSDFMIRVPRPLTREMIVFSANDLGEIR